MDLERDLGRWSPHMLGVMRIVCALTFLYCSAPALVHGLPTFDQPAYMLVFWISRWVQVLAGSFILVGLFTRIAALILSINFFIMYPYWYQEETIWPTPKGAGFTLASVICMYLVTAGAGRWSLDGLRSEMRNALLRQ